MNTFHFDFLSLIVIMIDIATIGLVIWYIFRKRQKLWTAAKIVMIWIILVSFYHVVIYSLSLFAPNPDHFIQSMLHPVVVFFVLDPLLLIILLWRGGRSL